ncbi:MAG TPA: ribonucleoside-diphosphate reductase subunit alpha [Thermodesulfobacteriota bacterium]|nr:ribonucleoside-diphosphate reductase subunit alpha [Thermodesulfobacteriota bacterium]
MSTTSTVSSVAPEPATVRPGSAPAGPPVAAESVRIRTAGGELEPLDAGTLAGRLARRSADLPAVDPERVARQVLAGLADGAAAAELARLAIETAALLTAEEPEYSRLAARLLADAIEAEVAAQGIRSFSDAVAAGHRLGLLDDRLAAFVARHRAALDAALLPERTDRLDYPGLRTLYERYLLRHPETRAVVETPQGFFLRVACGLFCDDLDAAVDFYRLVSALEYLPSSPTLFNAGTRHPQLASCFLLDSPADDLEAIYRQYADIALLSKFAGGIGVAYHRVRSRGSLIRGTNGRAQGIVPWLRTLDASVAAVDQGGKRRGACCVYLEPWHADIEEFLELRDSAGDPSRRTYTLNLALWVPDLFMRRVVADEPWSLFDPKVVPHLPDLYGEPFEAAYAEAERRGLAVRRVGARDLYGRMMRTLAETGNGWLCFKDACNAKSNQTGQPGRVVHSSNLCTEIVEVTGPGEVGVCTLGSLNLARHVADGRVDFDRLAANVRRAIRQLDRAIDATVYPIPAAADSNRRWRPVGLGVMGLQELFFQLRLPFDAPEARRLSRAIQEAIYFAALDASCELAARYGPHPAFPETRAARGELQFDAWGVAPAEPARWAALKARIRRYGLRNSLLVAIAPTATIATIAGTTEGIEPQVSNLFKRETLSGEFLQVNRYLVADLKARGLWTEETRARLLLADGSVRDLDGLPADLRALYRTAWEIPMRALIDMAADRGPFVDQSQSLNLFVESPSIGKLASMYLYAWQRGLKTTYYLRSRPATGIAKATVGPAAPLANPADGAAACDACQ